MYPSSKLSHYLDVLRQSSLASFFSTPEPFRPSPVEEWAMGGIARLFNTANDGQAHSKTVQERELAQQSLKQLTHEDTLLLHAIGIEMIRTHAAYDNGTLVHHGDDINRWVDGGAGVLTAVYDTLHQQEAVPNYKEYKDLCDHLFMAHLFKSGSSKEDYKTAKKFMEESLALPMAQLERNELSVQYSDLYFRRMENESGIGQRLVLLNAATELNAGIANAMPLNTLENVEFATAVYVGNAQKESELAMGALGPVRENLLHRATGNYEKALNAWKKYPKEHLEDRADISFALAQTELAKGNQRMESVMKQYYSEARDLYKKLNHIESQKKAVGEDSQRYFVKALECEQLAKGIHLASAIYQ